MKTKPESSDQRPEVSVDPAKIITNRAELIEVFRSWLGRNPELRARLENRGTADMFADTFMQLLADSREHDRIEAECAR